MKIPESAFPIINAIMRMLLRSPLHGLMSDSILVITCRGRRSGREYSTPARYLPMGDRLRCTTATHTQWWRNVSGDAPVSLLVAGELGDYRAEVLPRDPVATEAVLREFLAVYPQDAVYQDIRLNKDKSLNEEDLAAAVKEAIIVDFIPRAE
jgi:hypothetical protein